MSPTTTNTPATACYDAKAQRKTPPAKKPQLSPIAAVSPSTQKKVSRRSSKPIINWLQRKLAGTVRSKRDGPKARNAIPLRGVSNRVVSSPLPSTAANCGGIDNIGTNRQTMSLIEDSVDVASQSNEDLDSTSDQSSVSRRDSGRDSMWSPASALEADEDASLRPLPPSSPPSPSPSRSSSSYLSNPRTFRSIAASTKPTTLLSIDLHGNGMAHIAQAPVTPTSYRHHARNSSTATNPTLLTSAGSITFSALPPSSPSLRNSSTQTNVSISSVQAPLHTTHHPRNNPRPSSPPLDNASVLTLASSAYANTGFLRSPPSALGDSVSHYGSIDVESRSEFVLGDDVDERDVDASVRALRPRSSRRGSWESEVSKWSARIHVGTPSLVRDRSLWTANSVRTGAFSADIEYEKSEEADTEVEKSVMQSTDATLFTTGVDVDAAYIASPSVTSNTSEPTPKNIIEASLSPSPSMVSAGQVVLQAAEATTAEEVKAAASVNREPVAMTPKQENEKDKTADVVDTEVQVSEVAPVSVKGLGPHTVDVAK
ncbi:uncharacterized protein BT62DRAFT_1076296 [Guyanagaster necrorhizus]|uniref:Uncharacterized protein n=1 Tax=Guyanagaster necrorhizus TaxID=856835 RepID=A0A9P7VS79_9AGAR|nr:uncharacterized protein BT62DRAFT_1076296 [Guyanagaster necrorhizus MCA 3950]KAG7445877.1 hypothetical protein BT62DRAFT_1076296 [Guyanagaster necrorhizus MCA 3950]